LGGGTGSGLGTRLIESIYDEFNLDIYAQVVLPNKSGETPLQIYNCLLSLDKIQQHSTAIFVYLNDNMISAFLASRGNGEEEGVTMKGNDLDCINELIADTQARFFRIN
jgi:tubulin delta